MQFIKTDYEAETKAKDEFTYQRRNTLYHTLKQMVIK